jgi:hypothetical protein
MKPLPRMVARMKLNVALFLEFEGLDVGLLQMLLVC